MPVLSINNVTKVYPGGKTALRDLTLTVRHGEFGLLGLNGAGKTTLLNILSGEHDCEHGSVSLEDLTPFSHPTEWRRHMAYMPQSFDFVPNMTAREILEQTVVFRGYSRSQYKRRIDEILEKVRLEEASNREAFRFSRGMKQRLMIAAALLCPVDLVLLDEPTSGLDPKERVLFRELLSEESNNRIVILSTHIVGDVERCCGEIGIIADASLIFTGAPGKLIQSTSGKVWEFAIETHEIDEVKNSFTVSRLFSRQDVLFARVVSNTRPAETASSVSATLEDAYISLLSDHMPRVEAS